MIIGYLRENRTCLLEVNHFSGIAQVAYSLLMPANSPTSEKALEFQFSFIRSGGIPLLLGMLSKNNFLAGADVPTKR